MADLLSCTVDPGGTGNYTSHQAAETANYGNAGASLVSTDKYVECSLICTNGAADAVCVIAGITTDATHYIDISVPEAYHHRGFYPTSGNFYRAAATSVPGVINCQISNVFVQGVAISITPGGSNNTGFIAQTGGNQRFEDIVIKVDGTTAEAWPRAAYVYGATGVVTIRNVLGYDAKSSGANKGQGFRVSNNASGTVNFQNCGVVDSDNGFEYDNSGTVNLKNCYVFNISGTEYNGTYSSATYCGYSVSDPGSNGVSLSGAAGTDLFRNYTGDNFKIKDTNSALYGVAENLSGTFTTDFEGQTRNQWSLGPDELERTKVPVIVDTGGTGSYTSLSAACTATFGVTNVDLLLYDEYVECTCISTDGAADSSAYANQDGLTTDATHNVTILGGAGYRWASGDPTDGAHYRLLITTDTALLIQDDYTVVDGIAAFTVPTTGYPSGIYVNANYVTIKNCIVGAANGVSTGTYGINLAISGRTCYLKNCITWTQGTGAHIGLRIGNLASAGTVYAYNCDFISPNWDGAFIGNNATIVAKNCRFHGVDGDGNSKDVSLGASGVIHADSTHNAYFHAEPAAGSNWVDYSAFAMALAATTYGANLDQLFADVTVGDMRLRLSAVTADGTDLSGDAVMAVTDDILGTARGATPFIGATEEVGDAYDTTDWVTGEFPAGEEDLNASRWALAGMYANQWQPTPGFPIGGF